MTIRSSRWPAGVPCWTDLSTPDVAAAQAFYAEVLGWTYADTGDEYGGYSIAQVRDAAAAGIGPLQPGAPSAWTLYLASENADRTAEAVTAHGGQVMLPPGDVGGLGRLLVAADPSGAVFGVWQAGTHIGSEITGEPGGIAWEDLRSHDPGAARAFYSAVFGFATEPLGMAGPDYHTFNRPDEPFPLGGMGDMMGQDELPSHWLVYFAVADTDAAVAAAERNGGRVLAPTVDSPFGRLGALADPAGAVFMVIQLSPDQPTPDRAG